MTGKESVSADLVAKLQAAKTLEEILPLFGEAYRFREEAGYEFAISFANSLTRAAASATHEKPELVAKLIDDNLMPFVELKNGNEKSPDRFPIEQDYLRENIRDWVYQFPYDQMVKVRSDLLSCLEAKIRTNPSESHFWCVSKIGFRTESLDGLLWDISLSEKELWETAASTLIATGLTHEEEERILSLVATQVRNGADEHFARIAIQEIVGPQRMDIAESYLVQSLVKDAAERSFGPSLSVAVVTRAVDRCDDDHPMHERIWDVLRDHEKIVRMSGEYGFRCNSASVVLDYFQWLKKSENAESGHWTYIYLSRLSEFVKPRHLAGWRQVNDEAIVRQLVGLVEKDTNLQGEYTTTDSKLKSMALEALLCLGFQPTESMVATAVLDESSGSVSHEVSELFACVGLPELPDRVCEIVKSSQPGDDEDSDHFFRNRGLQDLTQSCRSRKAFEAILNFGSTYENEVLLSTVDAIADLALARIEAGDKDVVDLLVESTDIGRPIHNRQAAASVFCRLSSHGYVANELSHHLRSFTRDLSLGQATQEDAIQAIAKGRFEIAEDWKKEIIELVNQQDFPLCWAAIEVIIRRDWNIEAIETLVLAKLSIVSNANTLRISNPESLSGWQAYLLGLLYEKDPGRYSGAVASIFAISPNDVFYQLIKPIQRNGPRTPSNVIFALRSRIELINNEYSTDTDLLSVLAQVSPESLLQLSRSKKWSRWMVEGRVALCEAASSVATENLTEIFLPFIQDAAYQVRRSAYRALATKDHILLHSLYRIWNASGEVENEKRTAELLEWLPHENYPDEVILAMGFQGHREPSVRKAFTDVLQQRRRRIWANGYVERLLARCNSRSENLAEVFRLSRALAALGDDDSKRRIEHFVEVRKLPRSTRNLLERTVKQLDKQWKQTTSRWPEPWSHVVGAIEECKATFVKSDGSVFSAKARLWRKHRYDQTEKYSWGGIADDLSENVFNERELTLQLSGRGDSKVVIGSSILGESFQFWGHSEYPNLPVMNSRSVTAFEFFWNALEAAKLDVPDHTAKKIAESIQPLLDSMDFEDAFPTEGENRVNGFQLRAMTLVLQAIGSCTKEVDPNGLLVWRLAHQLLARTGHELRLTPSDLSVFALLCHSTDADSLLFWINENVLYESRAVDFNPNLSLKPHSEFL
jgi:hypothetical protein